MKTKILVILTVALCQVAVLAQSISLTKATYDTGETIPITWSVATGGGSDWIGVYNSGETPGGATPSTLWAYISTASGSINMGDLDAGPTNWPLPAGDYYVALLLNDSYTIADQVSFSVVIPAGVPTLSSDKATYTEGEGVEITTATAPNNSGDWVGIFKIGEDPTVATPVAQQNTSATAETMTFSSLPKAYYFAAYFLTGGKTESGSRINFQVGTEISTVAASKADFTFGEDISISYANGPGLSNDWIAIYDASVTVPDGSYIEWSYVTPSQETAGTVVFSPISHPKGNYYAVLLTNDSYTEISNKSYFTIDGGVLGIHDYDTPDKVFVYPNPVNGYTTINLNETFNKVELLDNIGRKVLEVNNLNTNKHRLNIKSLTPGMYIIRVHADRVYDSKIIIQ